jgi:glycerol-3-phosphate dehydrogenase (NAD(P)+)
MSNKKIAVLGGGSWATAIVSILSTNVDELVWCMRNESAVQHIKQTQHNPNYLVGVSINTDKVSVSSDFKTTCEHADVIILAIPSAFLHAALDALDLDLSKKNIFLCGEGNYSGIQSNCRRIHSKSIQSTFTSNWCYYGS